MTEDGFEADIGFVITKGPVETGIVEGILRAARHAQDAGRRVGVFLISDGVWLAKRGASNPASGLFRELIDGGAEISASGDHLMAAGIAEDDVIPGVTVTRRPYRTMVELVMESWGRVVVV
ncbi:MAG TPA: hypothetical protein EYP43_00305 [Thermoplasmata archaeon]|nr:hypothetical protein [Thermoplasmata archaeon]